MLCVVQFFLVLGPIMTPLLQRWRCKHKFVFIDFLHHITSGVHYLDMSDRNVEVGPVNFIFGSFSFLGVQGCPLHWTLS